MHRLARNTMIVRTLKIPRMTRLVEWHQLHQAGWPFRRTTDPYRILVSEIMLRQTTSRQVTSVYNEFFAKYPGVEQLARANLGQLRKLLQPLGLRKRAETLVLLAGVIVRKHGGRVPGDIESLMNLPGVGRYTASCVLSFGFGIPTPMVDVNVARVLQRLHGVSVGQDSSVLQEIYRKILDQNSVSVHYALIDLAHKTCTLKSPQCPKCPLRKDCTFANLAT